MGLGLCGCRQEAAQARSEAVAVQVATVASDPIQDLLNQNAQLIAANKQLMAEVAQLQAVQGAPSRSVPDPGLFIPAQPGVNTEELWRQTLEIANTSMIDSAEKQKFLQTGSELIQKIAAATAAQQSAQEMIDALEVSAQDDEAGDALLKLAAARLQAAAAQAEIEQYQRDLLTCIEPYKRLQPPQLTLPYIPPENVMSYDGLSISPFATVTADNHFLVTISFVVTNSLNSPRVANVTTLYDLTTLQTVVPAPTPTGAPTPGNCDDEECEEFDDEIEAAEEFDEDAPAPVHYEYPANFQSQIHKAVKQAWRAGLLRWNRKLTQAELLLFVQLINRKDFTPIVIEAAEEDE